jgi:hypothetical protein
MKVLRQVSSDYYIFKAGERKTTHFLFLLSDLSAFGNPAKKPMGIRGNYRKCMKLLLSNKLNEFRLVLKDGEYFKVDSPVFSRGRSKKDIEEYLKMYKKGEIKVEPSHLEVQITIPAGNAIKVYSIEEGFYTYFVNEAGIFRETNDFEAVEAATGVYF